MLYHFSTLLYIATLFILCSNILHLNLTDLNNGVSIARWRLSSASHQGDLGRYIWLYRVFGLKEAGFHGTWHNRRPIIGLADSIILIYLYFSNRFFLCLSYRLLQLQACQLFFKA